MLNLAQTNPLSPAGSINGRKKKSPNASLREEVQKAQAETRQLRRALEAKDREGKK